MSFSPSFKWFIAILLPLTLAWKVVGAADAGDPALKNKIIELLAQHQYEVATSYDVVTKMLVVRGSKGSCRLLVAPVTTIGGDYDYIRHLAGDATENIFVLSQGNLYTDQATWATLFNELRARFLRKFGLGHASVVLAVAATPACDAQQLPWNEVWQ